MTRPTPETLAGEWPDEVATKGTIEMSVTTINAMRRGGVVRSFTGDSQAQAWDKARAWLKAEDDVVAAAQRLLAALADAREMLEDTDESGETREAFINLESAVRAASAVE